jgi:phosphoenolpyruvate carboxykinase (ATP)
VQFYPGSNRINFGDGTITENSRVSYPLHYIHNAVCPAEGPIPKNIFFLTCDAHAVLPPLSRLTAPQAMYQFISGYTAKVAGTETGITEPKSTFSPCFSAPFLPLHPSHYAHMLGRKMQDHGVQAWLVNTGWTGGPLGTGSRIALAYTRAMISAVLQGQLNQVAFEKHPVFGMAIPTDCPGVPAQLLNPRSSWAHPQEYDQKARYLAGLFAANFEKYRHRTGAEVLAAGPVL